MGRRRMTTEGSPTMTTPEPLTTLRDFIERVGYASAAEQEGVEAALDALRTPTPAEPGLREAAWEVAAWGVAQVTNSRYECRACGADMTEAMTARLATTPDTLDVGRLRDEEALWGHRCTGCGGSLSACDSYRPDRKCCPDCEHVSYFRLREDRS